MTKTLTTILGTALVLAMTSTAQATPLAVGDQIRFSTDPPVTEVGRFGIQRASEPGVNILWTFCLEINEFLNSSDTFQIYDISSYAHAGGVGGTFPINGTTVDPISGQTAKLFLESLYGDFSGVASW